MSKRFSGEIDVDIRDSQADWEPYLQPVAPPGSPNVLYIVTDDYPGERPYAFTGGTIKEAVIDLSGEQYVDLEREALAMMKRE